MVIRSPGRSGSWILLMLSLWCGADRARGADSLPNAPIPAALGRGSYPWYDARTDQVRALKLPSQPEPASQAESLLGGSRSGGLRWGWADYLVFGGFVAALTALVILVIRYWKRYEPTAEAGPVVERPQPIQTAGLALPASLRGTKTTNDPWAEANRLRLAGDFAGAVVCLFAHQLLTLARLDLVRLAPGRTGRQLHRAIADAEFQTLMVPTLRQFEAVYYGHHDPTTTDFAVVWEAAEAFERRALTRVAG